MITWGKYLENVTTSIKGDGDLWLRYLRKVISDDGIKLTDDDIEYLLNSKLLSTFQKISLKDALTEGTCMNLHIKKLTRKNKRKFKVTSHGIKRI